MPTEADLRDAFRERAETPPRGIDVDEVIRRSRRRRRPVLIAVGGTVTLALSGIGVLAIGGLEQPPWGGSASTSSIADGSATDPAGDAGSAGGSAGESAESPAIGSAPAARLNLCGGAVAEVTPSPTGLVLIPTFPATAPATGSSVSGVVTLENTGTERMTGASARNPEITLSRDGIVVWHSGGSGFAIAAWVDLAPGESMTYTATFVPALCTAADDSGGAPPTDLPPLPAGEYEVRAAIDVALDSSASGSSLVTGPAAPLTLE